MTTSTPIYTQLVREFAAKTPDPRHAALDDTQAFDVPREVFTKEQGND